MNAKSYLILAMGSRWDPDGSPRKRKRKRHILRNRKSKRKREKSKERKGIPCVVAPQEAEFQAVKARPAKNPTVVTGDSDIIAYGSRKTILMKKWYRAREEYRIISFVNASTTQASRK
jgi:hypothetical protein